MESMEVVVISFSIVKITSIFNQCIFYILQFILTEIGNKYIREVIHLTTLCINESHQHTKPPHLCDIVIFNYITAIQMHIKTLEYNKVYCDIHLLGPSIALKR